ncbi:MAG: 1-acyl-sn-glycerol-3-phosphate acyltransferase [Bacteroidales bacterium]|nr:1-acyl-sn-glycerol-3-phosphate acyltransferase [Clostridium sp.]MCM1203802.1 1-acyl-sn-glycerol-3-phosphate acyltransferase [Bacteroidales bacterium]
MRSVLVLGFLFLFLVLMIPVHLILLLIGKCSPELRYRIGNAIVYWAFRWELFQAGAKIEVKGRENIPEEPVLFVPNHRSYFDILILHTTSTKRPGFVAKAEMNKFPLLNWWMKNICCLFLDREDMRSGMQMIKDGAALIQAGHSMVICPEGTRNQKPEMLPFREGSLKMAEKAGCPVVPVTLIGTDRLLEARPGFDIRKAEVKVIYGEPIDLKSLSKEKRKKAGAYVQGIIEETMKKETQAGLPGTEKEENV